MGEKNTNEIFWELSRQLYEVSDDSIVLGAASLKDLTVELIDLLRGAMWPSIFGQRTASREPSAIVVCDRLEQAANLLSTIISALDPGREDPDGIAIDFLQQLRLGLLDM